MGQRLVEDDAVTLVPGRQRKDRGLSVQVRQAIRLDPPGQFQPSAQSAGGDLRLQVGHMGRVPGVAHDHRLPVQIGQRRQRGDQHVMALARVQDAHRQDQRRVLRRGGLFRAVGAGAGDGDPVGGHVIAVDQHVARMRAGHHHVARMGQVRALGPPQMVGQIGGQGAFLGQGMMDHRHDGRADRGHPLRVQRAKGQPVDDHRPIRGQRL